MQTKNALVPLRPQARDIPLGQPERRAKADFVAHLIAIAVQAPQTRARRRAEPQEAVAVYRSLGQWPIAPGSTISRSF